MTPPPMASGAVGGWIVGIPGFHNTHSSSPFVFSGGHCIGGCHRGRCRNV